MSEILTRRKSGQHRSSAGVELPLVFELCLVLNIESDEYTGVFISYLSCLG